ncbi:acyl-CoA synthetase FdrA [soil metagenome]
MTRHVEVRSGEYHDSVHLMQTSQALSTVDGVRSALVAMGTELNVELLTGLGFDAPAVGPNDLLIAIEADGEDAVARALTDLTDSLAGHSRGGTDSAPAIELPRTVGMALRRSDAQLVLVSVPGPSAYVEALDALQAGRHVMVFSDNGPVEQEVALKEEGRSRGLLVMGPDCGTAIVQGVALGFANVVRRGGVGIVAASGTGAQQVSCLLDTAGLGVSHLLGVGGRDLSTAVAGRATMQALAALDDDPDTSRIVVVSKPAAPQVAERIGELAAGLDTPVHLALLGTGQPDLTTVVEKLLGATGTPVPQWPTRRAGALPAPGPGRLFGLFAGGTLADEAMVIASAGLGPIRSNIPLDPSLALDPGQPHPAAGHVVLDFGDDALTVGRPHPMIDPSLRLQALARAAADGSTSVVLLDVVLGYGADPDPADTLAPAIRAATGLAVVVSLCGTDADPQRWSAQADALAAAGAEVYASNAAAAARASALVAAGLS